MLLHGPDGRLISTISKPRLRKLSNIYHPQDTAVTFPEALSDAIIRHNTTIYRVSHTKERKLHKQHKQDQQLEYEEPWHIPDTLYDALRNCFNIKRVIHCNPINLPLRAKTYISHDPRDTRFSATPYTHTAWPGTSLAIPEYKPYRLKQALEQAIYSAHAHRHTSPSSHILILPNTSRTWPATYTHHTHKKLPPSPTTQSITNNPTLPNRN